MSGIPQKYSDEKALVDCVQRFFQNIMLTLLENALSVELKVDYVLFDS